MHGDRLVRGGADPGARRQQAGARADACRRCRHGRRDRRGIGASAGRGGRGRDRPSRIEGPCGDWSRKDNICTSDNECCTRVCDRSLGKENRDGKGRCRCLQRGDACREARNCCGSPTCAGGVCRVGGGSGGGVGGGSQGTCSAASCAGGCCQDGACLPGTEAAACGTGGGACVACSGGTPSCRAGVCSARAWQGTTSMSTGIQVSDVVEAPNGLVLHATQNIAGSVAMWTRAGAGAAWQPQGPLGSTGTANDQDINPWAVALSTNMQEMFVSDYANNRVAVWTRSTIGGTWTAQTPLGNGSGTGDDQFGLAMGMAMSPDGLVLYIADWTNNRVDYWARPTLAGAWAAQPRLGRNSGGSGVDQFVNPAGLGLSPDGLEMYVADQNKQRIAKWIHA